MAKGTYEGYKRGQCNVTSDKGVLRISIPAKLFGGKRRYIYTGLRDTRVHVGQVQQVVDIMNGDLLRSEFDFSLERYKVLVSPDGVIERNQEGYQGNISGVHEGELLRLWDRWVASLNLPPEKLNTHYAWTRKQIEGYDPPVEDASWVYQMDCAHSTFKERVGYCRRCVNWGIDHGLVKGPNPFNAIKNPKTKKKNNRKGFSKEEKKKILEEFKHPSTKQPALQCIWSWYYPMILFWFNSGLRTGEVIGLKWKSVKFTDEKIWIENSRSLDRSDGGNNGRYIDKPTKTGEEWYLPMTSPLEIALTRAQEQARSFDGYVFINHVTQPIHPGQFAKNVWKPALKRAGVDYQPPYHIRHTLLSEAVQDPKIGLAGAAKIAGHKSLEMVQEHYGGYLEEIRLPSSEGD